MNVSKLIHTQGAYLVCALAAGLGIGVQRCTAADTAAGSNAPANPDTPKRFRTAGQVTVTDTDSDLALDGLARYWVNDVDSPWAIGLGLAATALEAACPGTIPEDTCALNASIVIGGGHIVAPDGEPAQSFPDWMSWEITIPDGKRRRCVAANISPHLDHFDYYRVNAIVRYKDVVGGPDQLIADSALVDAVHVTDYDCENIRTGRALKASKASGGRAALPGSTVSYDAGTDLLSFMPGPITVLDTQGAFGNTTDPQYAADPVLNAYLGVTDLQYLGLDTDGKHEFGGGWVWLFDPNDRFHFDAGFGRYVIDDTTESPLLTSFAALDSVAASDVDDPLDGPSEFLQGFYGEHLFGEGLTPAEQEHRYIDFTFVTGQNLATLTNGFTTSVTDVPADIILVGCQVTTPCRQGGGCTCGDTDRSGGPVDLNDFAVFAMCFGQASPLSPECECADLDGNGIVDLNDFSTFANLFGLISSYVPPDCP